MKNFNVKPENKASNVVLKEFKFLKPFLKPTRHFDTQLSINELNNALKLPTNYNVAPPPHLLPLFSDLSNLGHIGKCCKGEVVVDHSFAAGVQHATGC